MSDSEPTETNEYGTKHLRTRLVSISTDSDQSKKTSTSKNSNLVEANLALISEDQNKPIIENPANDKSTKPNKPENLTKVKMEFNTNLLLKLVPTFDGSSSDLHHFLQCCDTFYETLNSPADKTQFLKIIPTRIKGIAYDKVVKYNTYDTWVDLKKALKTNCSETRTVEQISLELIHSQQRKTESAQEFGDRIEKLLYDLIDASIAREGEDAKTIVRNMHSKTALLAFTNGLNSEIKSTVKASKYANLKDAIKGAVDEELANKFFNTTVKPSPNTSVTHSSHANRPPPCQLCGKLFHTARNCQSRHTFQSRQSNESKTHESVNRYSLFCTYCKMNGHHYNECRNRTRQNYRSFNRSINKPNHWNTTTNSENLNQHDSQGAPIRAVDLQSANQNQ